jgi:hypothetical protein
MAQAQRIKRRFLTRRLVSSRVRNKQQLRASLKGKTLGQADGDTTTSSRAWVQRSREKEKEMAKKRQEEIENMDRALRGEEYTESAPRSCSFFAGMIFFLGDHWGFFFVSQRILLGSRSAMTLTRWRRARLVYSP